MPKSNYRPGQLESILANARARGMVANEPVKPSSSPVESSLDAPRVRTAEKKKPSAGEAAYEELLKYHLRNKEIRGYVAQAIKLSVGEPVCWYLPDFCVFLNDGVTRFVEIKGRMKWEDSIIKFKAATKQYPQFEFVMLEYSKGNWSQIY